MKIQYNKIIIVLNSDTPCINIQGKLRKYAWNPIYICEIGFPAQEKLYVHVFYMYVCTITIEKLKNF